MNTFEYPSVKRDLCEINTCSIFPQDFVKPKELLISKTHKNPYKFYQVIKQGIDGIIHAIDDNNTPISLKREEVYIVISYM
jgi:hypothetical protein